MIEPAAESQFVESHSGEVLLTLLPAGRSLRLSKVGPESITLCEPQSVPPLDATIRVTIDGREHFSRVRLPAGASPDDGRVEGAPADFSCVDQVQLKRSYVLGGRVFGRAPQELRKPAHVIRVGVDRLLRIIPQLHVFGHAAGECCHAVLPGSHGSAFCLEGTGFPPQR